MNYPVVNASTEIPESRMSTNTIKSIGAVAVSVLNFLVLGVLAFGSQGCSGSCDLLWYAIYWLVGFAVGAVVAIALGRGKVALVVACAACPSGVLLVYLYAQFSTILSLTNG